MSRVWTARRAYPMPSYMLFSYCMAALGHMRARVEAQDGERGTVVATIGGGLLAPITELALTLTPAGADRAELTAVCRARAWGGDRRVLTAFLERLDALVARA